jgi:hypothetical protein
VTANVVPSAWLVMDPNGERVVVVADAPDPKESFYHPRTLKTSGKRMKVDKKGSPAIIREKPAAKVGQPVQFTFPIAPKELELTQETVVMDVTDAGKTQRRAVERTTVVAR